MKEKSRGVHLIVEIKSREDPIFNKRKVENNTIDIPMDSYNIALNAPL